MRLNTIKDIESYRENLKEKIRKEKIIVRICITGCRAFGATIVKDEFIKQIKEKKLGNRIEIRQTGCQGLCAKAPVISIESGSHESQIFYQEVKPSDVTDIINKTLLNNKLIDRLVYRDLKTGQKYPYVKDIPFYKEQVKIVLRNCGQIDPVNIEHYILREGYSGFIKALNMKRESILAEVKKSGLRGRGGAGFPTGVKWEFVYKEKPDKYIICNGDEGDPGAFMDRAVLEGDPHSVLEGMLIGGYTIGAKEGYIYVRAEYPIAVAHLKIAIQELEKIGLLGENILGTGFNFKIHIREGAGAFVCGEETALIASIEGKRGMPRPRPPFPATYGLFGKPTNINNVETWANIAPIIINSGNWYNKLGTEKSKGTKVFSLAGKVNNTGLVEVPMGITLRKIIFDIGGGIPRDRKFKAVQTGGPSGGCIPAKYLDLSVDYESLASVGAIMGSGGMIITDEDTCMVDLAKFFMNFLREESCGKCTPCRIGTTRMFEILDRISNGHGKIEDIEILSELAKVIKNTSLCGLGQTSANPVLSTINYFRDEYETHINKSKCPAVVCEELISSPCRDTCPINDDVQGYIDYIKQNNFDSGFVIDRLTNPLPGICGRACYHPCEKKCKRGEIDKPVSIRLLKRAVSDYGKLEVKKQKLDKEKIAIIGSGPAGLSAGYFLAQKGYRVSIFESAHLPGGMLHVCIPSYRLPREIIKRDIDNIKALGVKIYTNSEVGKKIKISDLSADFKAVFLAIGAHKPSILNIPGENLKCSLSGVEFLKNFNFGKKIDLKGKKVLVIGGGNVAIDVARTSVRLGAKNVDIVYRRSREDMPASIEEIEDAELEGVKFIFFTSLLKIIGDTYVTGVEFIKMEPGNFDADGRRKPVPVKGSEYVVKCDYVFSAISQVTDFGSLDLPKNIFKDGKILFDSETLATAVPCIFVGGDMIAGPSTIVDAIASGKKAATSIDRFLKGDLKGDCPKENLIKLSKLEESVVSRDRIEPKKISIHKRKTSFVEVEKGFSKKEAILEAERCLQCDKRRHG